MSTYDPSDTQTALRFCTALYTAGITTETLEEILSDTKRVTRVADMLTEIVASSVGVEFIKTDIADTELDLALRNKLIHSGIITVGSLVLWTEEDLRMTSGFGAKTVSILKTFLQDNGMALRRYEETILEKALLTFSDVYEMPVAVLIDNISVNVQTAYYLRRRYSAMTIGELVEIGQGELEDSLRAASGSDSGRTAKASLESVRKFLQKYELQLKP